jgi:hypothetical protein
MGQESLNLKQEYAMFNQKTLTCYWGNRDELAMLAFKRAEQAFEGVAENAGFRTEEEMQDYVKEIRKEMGRY